jgi:hypothetical protein
MVTGFLVFPNGRRHLIQPPQPNDQNLPAINDGLPINTPIL